MRTHARAVIPFFLLLLVAIPASACEWHDNGLLQNSFGEFHLPPIGATAADVSRVYGKPMRLLNGPGGMDIWDYGSFRVMLKGNAVTFAGMW